MNLSILIPKDYLNLVLKLKFLVGLNLLEVSYQAHMKLLKVVALPLGVILQHHCAGPNLQN